MTPAMTPAMRVNEWPATPGHLATRPTLHRFTVGAPPFHLCTTPPDRYGVVRHAATCVQSTGESTGESTAVFTAPFHRSIPPLHSTAPFHRSIPPLHSTGRRARALATVARVARWRFELEDWPALHLLPGGVALHRAARRATVGEWLHRAT